MSTLYIPPSADITQADVDAAVRRVLAERMQASLRGLANVLRHEATQLALVSDSTEALTREALSARLEGLDGMQAHVVQAVAIWRERLKALETLDDRRMGKVEAVAPAPVVVPDVGGRA